MGATYFVVDPKAVPYKDIALVVGANSGHMFVADSAVDCIHSHIPYFDFHPFHIGSFD